MENKIKTVDKEEVQEVSGMRDAIIDAITKKAMYEMKECNESNPVYLGGVKFYFTQTANGPYLVYDKHPKEWNEQKIKEDINDMEHYFLKLRGMVE